MPFHRITVALDASRASGAALDVAARLARSVEAELVGLFVEDPNLARWSSLSFARAIGAFTGAPLPLSPPALREHFARQREKAEAMWRRSIRDLGVRGSFRIAQGAVADTLLRALGETDLLGAGKGRSGLGAVAGQLLARLRGRSLLLAREPPATGRVAVVVDSSPQALQTLHLAADLSAERRITALYLGGGAPPALDAVLASRCDVHWLTVPPHGAALVAQLAQRAGAGILVVPAGIATLPPRVLEAIVRGFPGPVVVAGAPGP